MRVEKDLIGSMDIDDDALYGIHAARARNNFPHLSAFSKEWYAALGSVKKACYITCKEFTDQVKSKYPTHSFSWSMDESLLDRLVASASCIENMQCYEHFIVPAISGGAGTSINMNINEIIANLTLLAMGHKPGEYNFVDPIEHANIFQSTNDVIPTSLKVALMRLLVHLEDSINLLRQRIEYYEKNHRNDLRIAYTQMQEAVPTSFGRFFSTFNDALSRDWWRVSKCSERIKVVNLGGSAIGSGITVPRFFIMEVVQNLQRITNLSVVRAENMNDATCNLDAFVEVHGILKAHGVNLEKISNDIRILASDLAGKNEIGIPQIQVGSSIMPAKINPVICEFIISAVHKVYANDILITSLCSQSCLELNAYLPIIGHCMIESIKLLIACDQSALLNLFSGLVINGSIAHDRLIHSAVITTALLPYIGYHNASVLAQEMKKNKIDIFKANGNLNLIDSDKLAQILQPENLLKEGFSINDLLDQG